VSDLLERVSTSLARQGLMQTLGVRVLEVAAGRVTLELPISDAVSQQNGFVHAGAISSVLDSACGYAALSLMPEGSDVLAVEFKVNFVAPAMGVAVHAVADAVKSGRTITVCRADAFAVAADGTRKLVALMQATMVRRDA
jgi:uncharacterized protein (TIGR00369 family)